MTDEPPVAFVTATRLYGSQDHRTAYREAAREAGGAA